MNTSVCSVRSINIYNFQSFTFHISETSNDETVHKKVVWCTKESSGMLLQLL